MSEEKFWNLFARKLAGEATEAELAELEQLMRAHPDWHYPMQHIQDIWQQPVPSPSSESSFEQHLSRMRERGIELGVPEEKPVRSGKKRVWMIAGTAILMLAIGAFFFINGNKTEHSNLVAKVPVTNEISTRPGSKSKIVLPDGSTVWLNAGSKIVYDPRFGTEHRELTLSGEAYFDVVKNPDQPFVIHTSKIDVKVVGTAFNVRSYPSERVTETSLIRGIIEVTLHARPSDKIILKPNEKLVVANEDEETRKPLQPARSHAPATNLPSPPLVEVRHLSYLPVDSTIIETSWLENKLIFRSETFEDLAMKMERWYGVTIRFNTEKIRQKKFTGIFANETLPQALTALQLIAPFHYTITKQEIIIEDNPN
jgi:transmembrane sensor